MKTMRYIYTDGNHKWAVIARDPEKPGTLIDTNEYLVIKNDEAIITDPGGLEIFPAVFSGISEEFNPESITGIFSSHQDPDIISSLSLWLEVNPSIKCYLSWLWKTFVPHFGGNKDTFVSIPDKGMDIPLGDLILSAIPAHYLHSSGNFNLYDNDAGILFSGDIGAALLPAAENGLFVEDFDKHIQYMEVFHLRWMSSNTVKQRWCEQVSSLSVDMLCPQHGKIFRGNDVERFINWFSELEVGRLSLDEE